MGIGVALGILNLKHPKSLQQNIIRRLVFIVSGFCVAWLLDKSFLHLSIGGFFIANVVGLALLGAHLLISGGVKLQRQDISTGLLKTNLLPYLVELPAEEFLYCLFFSRSQVVRSVACCCNQHPDVFGITYQNLR